MSITLFGVTLIPTWELETLRSQVAELTAQVAESARKLDELATPAVPGRDGQGEEEPPRIVRELIRFADRLPDLAGAAVTGDRDGSAEPAAHWLDTRAQALLTACDVVRIDDGGPVDLRRHEVVGTRAAPSQDLVHQIVGTVRPGYLWRGRLLRPQQVLAYIPAA